MSKISKVYAISDLGKTRVLNEDSQGYFKGDNFSVYIVADGMGGHNAGEVASKIAVDEVINSFSKNPKCDLNNVEDDIVSSIVNANLIIYEKAKENSNLSGMGTTVTMLLETKDTLYFANVGDSSAYLIVNNTIKKITKDHSLIQELIDNGSITEEEAIVHPNRNVITRAVGTSESVKVDIFKLKNDFDYIFLCSDGLTNELTSDEILKEIINSENSNLDKKGNKLIELANAKGGNDNITLLLIEREDLNV